MAAGTHTLSAIKRMHCPPQKDGLLQVDDSTCNEQLVNVIKGDPDFKAGKAKILVFAGDTAAADGISSLFDQSSIK